MKAKQLITELTEKLLPYAEDSREIINLIFSEITGKDAFLESISGNEVSDVFRDRIKTAVMRCIDGEPVQYVLGKQYFMGNEFSVRRGVLIPRADTEIICERVIEIGKGKRILDLCCGSGCIGISAAKALADARVDCVDISDIALEVTNENILKNSTGKNTRCFKSDLLSQCGVYDIIVSNPPYIPTDVISTLDGRVKNYEPTLALDGGTDGLDFYRAIASEAKKHLNEDGKLLFEIGYDQRIAVTKLLEDNGYKNIVCRKDYSGNDRVTECSV